ncbi:transcription elongation factor SPT6 [Crepidotus variabilis]|uniref:Transcription elongation factor Spt6 n=1 Tax=Crepidotus variabilis TaxID=179855 RepID=A0A9P6EUW5_9AGAR|nr:transcription elongation factor SPT6 [Crepidotus variabilis]
MQGSVQEEEGEGEGEDVGMGEALDDSSEEEEEDEEEEKKIRDGFIVDEEEEEEEEEVEKKPRKRRKRHHRREEEETLEDDDLELLEENTGRAYKRKSRFTRLRHRSESPPTASSSKRQNLVVSSDDDLDNEEDNREVPDISKIWDDDRGGDDDEEDLGDFIEYSDEEEGAMNEETRSARREEKRQEVRRKRARVRPELAGIDANAWDEIHEVFGDGHEYDWALVGDDDAEMEEEHYKPEMKYQDVFEPSEIKKRMLTDDDDLIRAMDIPERMQLATSSLSDNSALSLHTPLTEEDLGGAAMWVTQRLSEKKTVDFFSPDGELQHLKSSLVMAVTFVLRQLFVEEYEVPYIWVHKRDYISHFDVQNVKQRIELLDVEELWRINSLGQKFRSLLERKKAVAALYQRLGTQDPYYENVIESHLESVEVVADATEWLSMKYKEKKENGPEFRFHDDEEAEVDKKRKMPSRVSAYEVAKKTIVAKLAEKFGIQAHQVVQNFIEGHHLHFVDDVDVNPLACAEQFVDPDPSKTQAPEELLRRARLIISTELGKDPVLRTQFRRLYKEDARFTVEPTERGVGKIDENHPYYNFKYLQQKPISELLKNSGGQFLHILAAESEHLVTVTVSIPPDLKAIFERKLIDAFSSDSFTEAAKAWNAERALIVQEVLEQHLVPIGIKWAREVLRDEVEDLLAAECYKRLKSRLDTAPFVDQELRYGEFATSVLAISWGKGDPHKDAITLVYVDELGRLREHTKIDNLFDQDNLDEFVDLLNRRKPGVAVIGGFTVATLKLMQRVKEVFRGGNGAGPETDNFTNQIAFEIPAIYVHDDVARLYQNSKRAAEEFSALSPTAKYCVGLARYVQSPLNEFAALGNDITAISLDEDNQNLVPKEKLLSAFEQALVDTTNKVGVEINRAVTDPYYQHLLRFVCGLGPRKAEVLVKKIASQGGMLANRDQFIKGGLLTTKIFLNAAGFLRIIQQAASKRHQHDDDAQDPLDDTRIHPEDYELARKMAMDALELDEEDVTNEHPSHVVTLLMGDKDRDRKLLELNLDEFAISLYEANHDQKRHTLNLIREELSKPFAETRARWSSPSNWEIVTMLTGETKQTLVVPLIVTSQVYRITKEEVNVRLDSGIEAYIQAGNLAEGGGNPYNLVKKGQTITAVVIELLNFETGDVNQIKVELSSRPDHMAEGDSKHFRRVRPDAPYWDDARFSKDKEMLARKKRAENDRSRRVIRHPNFHNFNTAQAETYLEKQQRGDVVIRPSSKGANHLAITWKVDDKLYQHIDVTELNNADPNSSTVGSTLVVDSTHVYSDLDELIVNHVQAMARRVEELMAHDKFKHGSEDDLHLFLKNYLTANPSKSMYGFTLNRKRPGHFNLCFLANKNSTVQTWPIRVTPEAYYLFDAPAVGVPELCDAFKVRHLHESQNLAAAAAGGRTPFGAGMRTPARPGGATPGHMSIRQVGRTPNPYSGGQTPFQPPIAPQNFGAPPAHPAPPYGFQTPAHRPPFPNQPPLPPNINPHHAPPVWGGASQRWP